jgi:homoserine kinase type II
VSLPPAEAALIHSLLEAWPLELPVELQRVTGGATHRVYRVASGQGLAFLRVYRRADPALAAREHALIAHVRALGVPAVALIPARNGATVVEQQGAVCALYEPASGLQLTGAQLRAEHASGAGACLARVHRALLPLQDVGYLRWTLSWDQSAWVERLNVAERALLARGVRDETDGWALERLRGQRSWLAGAECVHSYQPRCPGQVVHGDYQDANLFFQGEAVSAVIDWEQAAFMPRGYEIARACWFMFRLEPERTGHFLAGYRAHEVPGAELGLAELEDGACAWGCFADHHVWPLEEVYLNGNDAARRYIPHVPFRPFRDAWAQLKSALG